MYSIELKWDDKKLKYDMKTRWGEYDKKLKYDMKTRWGEYE